MSKSTIPVAGIDTGKQWLDIALYPAGEQRRFANDADGHHDLAAWLAARSVARIGIEASGGYEQAVVACLRQHGLDVALLQPRQVRAFALYKLRRAKNDRLDAALIAECTANLTTVHQPPDPRLAPMAEHLLFIEQLELDIARLKTRRERFTDKRLLLQIDRHVATLQRRREAELTRLQAVIRRHDDLARRLDLIASVDGIRTRTALTLLILLPELGSLSREQAAALAGVAPFDNDSAARTGQRHIAGGRDRVRRALFNAALPAAYRWNDNLKAQYQRLRGRGKHHKSALIACARKLLIFANAVLHRGSPWTKSHTTPNPSP
jgi:transposase